MRLKPGLGWWRRSAGRMQTGPQPYCHSHREKLNVPNWRGEMMFSKWYRRNSWPAHALYWRSHPDEVWW